jgi:GT2 family glycosyltransferase
MTAEPSEPITILLPVYGRADLLEPALASLLAQTSPAWRLLIADDGSDPATLRWLEGWFAQHGDGRVQWIRRPHNLGLFANLNLAISEAETDWVLLLCSDDLLLPSAVATLAEARDRWPVAGLILSTFYSINADGRPRPADSAWHHDQVSRRTALIPPERFLPALLELGSLNGNLTGMAFSRSLWQQAGPFRDDWRHAADWEWLIRAAEQGPLLLSREPIAQVRTHPSQLSNANRTSGHELQEVAEVVAKLHHHLLLANEPRRHRWAAHVMQFHLWTLLKRLGRGDFEALRPTLGPIHRSAGLMQTGLALLAMFPQRWRSHRKGTSR